MPARSIGSATVSFGLVSIPIKVYAAGESGSSVSFNMLHEECGNRLKQQLTCPKCDVIVARNETARGYEFAKGQYVKLSDEEYKALQEVASNTIELTEFLPADSVDPVFFDRAYYLGPDKGGDRAYRLLSEAMEKTELIGLAKYAARGKQYLVLVRPQKGRLVMHQLHYPDEIRSADEVPVGDATKATSKAELDMAVKLIEQFSKKTFDPSQYEDEVKGRMLELIEKKIEGQEITHTEEAGPQAQIIDLMDALKASLGQKPNTGTKRAGGAKKKAADAERPAATRTKKKASK